MFTTVTQTTQKGGINVHMQVFIIKQKLLVRNGLRFVYKNL